MGKATETITAALSVISPGQEQEIWKSLRLQNSLSNNQETKEFSRRKHFDPESELIDVLVKAHNEVESWKTKREILSLFANDFSRTELKELIPGLSKWRIDPACQHGVVTGKGQPVLEKPVFRTRIEMGKIDHFLDFISRPDMIQDVAFATKTMKLDSGERIIIPAVIRTVIPSQIIQQYTSYCKQQDFVLCFHAKISPGSGQPHC